MKIRMPSLVLAAVVASYAPASAGVTGVPYTQNVTGTVNAAVVGGNTTAVKVDGSAVTQPVSGNVGVTGTVTTSVSNFPATQPVSGTVNAENYFGGADVTNTNPLVVDSQNISDVTGSVSSATASSVINIQGHSCVQFTTSGTYSLTFQPQENFDAANPNWVAVKDISGGGTYTGSALVSREVCVPGAVQFRINVSAYTSGTLSYTFHDIPSTASLVGLASTNGNSVTSGGVAATGVSNSGVSALDTRAFLYAYNGSNYQVPRTDAYTNGPLWTSQGGGTRTDFPGGATTTTTIKTGAGRLTGITNANSTSQGTTIFSCYDNTAASGTGIYSVVLGASQTVALSIPFSTGLTCTSNANLVAGFGVNVTSY